MEVEKKPRSGAITKVRSTVGADLITIQQIVKQNPELSPEQVSMSLCHLLKKEQVEREQIDRQTGFGRKKVWAYRVKSK